MEAICHDLNDYYFSDFLFLFVFFFNDTATTEIYTLSLHDALPISLGNSHVRENDQGFLPTILQLYYAPLFLYLLSITKILIMWCQYHVHLFKI